MSSPQTPECWRPREVVIASAAIVQPLSDIFMAQTNLIAGDNHHWARVPTWPTWQGNQWHEPTKRISVHLGALRRYALQQTLIADLETNPTRPRRFILLAFKDDLYVITMRPRAPHLRLGHCDRACGAVTLLTFCSFAIVQGRMESTTIGFVSGSFNVESNANS